MSDMTCLRGSYGKMEIYCTSHCSIFENTKANRFRWNVISGTSETADSSQGTSQPGSSASPRSCSSSLRTMSMGLASRYSGLWGGSLMEESVFEHFVTGCRLRPTTRAGWLWLCARGGARDLWHWPDVWRASTAVKIKMCSSKCRLVKFKDPSSSKCCQICTENKKSCKFYLLSSNSFDEILIALQLPDRKTTN